MISSLVFCHIAGALHEGHRGPSWARKEPSFLLCCSLESRQKGEFWRGDGGCFFQVVIHIEVKKASQVAICWRYGTVEEVSATGVLFTSLHKCKMQKVVSILPCESHSFRDQRNFSAAFACLLSFWNPFRNDSSELGQLGNGSPIQAAPFLQSYAFHTGDDKEDRKTKAGPLQRPWSRCRNCCANSPSNAVSNENDRGHPEHDMISMLIYLYMIIYDYIMNHIHVHIKQTYQTWFMAIFHVPSGKDAFFSKVPAQKRNAADAHVPALGLTAPVLVLTTLRGHGKVWSWPSKAGM